jgi:sulfite exporter TauE/SafE
MLLFGLGVMPSLIMLSIFGHWASVKWRNIFQKVYPFAAIFLGAFLIFRGFYFINLEKQNAANSDKTEIPMCGGHNM